MAQTANNLPATQETRVWSLSWEDPLVEEMATHSSILAWLCFENSFSDNVIVEGTQRLTQSPIPQLAPHPSIFCCPSASGKLISHCHSLSLFTGLDSLPPNQEATLSILPAHFHIYRMSMWCKAPSSSWTINTASRFRWKTWLTSESFSWTRFLSSHPARLGSW